MLAQGDWQRNLGAFSRLLGAGDASLSTSLEKRREIERPMLGVLDLLEC